MGEKQWLAEKFEGNRAHLRGVAYRMLGSLSEADDALQLEASAKDLLQHNLDALVGWNMNGGS